MQITCHFEVHEILFRWIWLVDDCVITFLPTKAHACNNNMVNLIDGPAIDTRIQAIIRQWISSSWKAVMKGIITPAVELWKCLCYGSLHIWQPLNGWYWWREFSVQPLMECWQHILSGYQVCNWGIQYLWAVHIEDCEVWWLSSCCGSVAEHWWLKAEVSWIQLSATTGLFTSLFLPYNI